MTPQIVTRLTAPIAGTSVLLLLLAVVAAWYVRDMQERASGPIARSVASVTAAQELEISIREVSTQCNRYLITLDHKYLDKVPALKKHTAEALANAEAASLVPSEHALMKRTRDGYDHFSAEYDRLLKHPPAQGLYPSIFDLTDNVLNKEILEPAHEYLRLNEEMLARASETNQQLARRLTIGLLAIGLCGSAGGLLGGWVIAAAIRRSLKRSQERLLDAARQLDAAVPGSESWDGSLSSDTVEQVHVSVTAVLRRLRQTERDALRAEQLAWVGQMAAGIAHEIRNPLAAIKILIQAAADRPGGPALRPRDFPVLEEEITRLEQIVTEFLDFARPPRPEPRPVDVGELVDQVLCSVRTKAELQGVQLVMEPPARPVIASADPNQLRQVLLNLIFNALDAQPAGGEIRIAMEILDEGTSAPQFFLSMTDGGPGLPAGKEDRIFEPFFSTKESGLGLGLSICRRIAESHGGTLTAANGPSGGAVFSLRFPAAQPQQKERLTLALEHA
jgi:signal transduction histidine kinase